MLRTLVVAALAGWLAFGGPAQAQATADQLNKLSLESLTAPPPGGGGYRATPRRSHAVRANRSYAARPVRHYGYGRRTARPHAYSRRQSFRHGYRIARTPRHGHASHPTHKRAPRRY